CCLIRNLARTVEEVLGLLPARGTILVAIRAVFSGIKLIAIGYVCAQRAQHCNSVFHHIRTLDANALSARPGSPTAVVGNVDACAAQRVFIKKSGVVAQAVSRRQASGSRWILRIVAGNYAQHFAS